MQKVRSDFFFYISILTQKNLYFNAWVNTCVFFIIKYIIDENAKKCNFTNKLIHYCDVQLGHCTMYLTMQRISLKLCSAKMYLKHSALSYFVKLLSHSPTLQPAGRQHSEMLKIEHKYFWFAEQQISFNHPGLFLSYNLYLNKESKFHFIFNTLVS